MNRTSQHTWLTLVTLIVAIVAVFALDAATPLGVPIYILYFPILAVAAVQLSPRVAWILFGVCAVLTAVGAFLSPGLLSVDRAWMAIEMQLVVIPVAAVILWLILTTRQSQAALRETYECLRKSNEQLRQFVEQAPAAVAMFDRDMRYLAHSRRWVRNSAGHYDANHSLVGTLHYTEFPDFPEHWKDAHRRALNGETVRCEHDEFVLPDGSKEVTRWETIPWHDNKGQVGGVLLFVEQITERAQIERQWRDSEALYRSLVEHIPRGVFRKDLEGRYTFANQLYCEMLGKPVEVILGTTDDDHFPQELAAKHRTESRHVIETGSELNVLEEHKAPERPARHVRIVNSRLVDGNRCIIGTQGIAEDVTEHHLEREALRRSEQQFRTLAEHLPDLVVRYDRQLRFVYINRAFREVIGNLTAEFYGMTNADVGLPEKLVRMRDEKLLEVIATGCEQTSEFSYPNSRGLRYFESRIVPELATDGTVETVLCISRDVTERVRAQQQAEWQLAELGHLTRLITIGELTSEIAHEINQPLHAIVNFAQASINVLEKAPLNHRPNLFDWLRQISEQANRAAEIIRRVGRFARKAPVRRSTVNLNVLVRDCLNLLNYDLRLNHVSLQCELADTLPPLLVDTVQIQQLVVNLVRNAVDAMSENAASDRELLVRTTVSDNDLQFSLCDNGIGLSSETSVKLFEPFFTTKPEGLGLGLSVCHSIVKANRGRLWAEPNPDRGTTFHFTLPRYKEEPHDVVCHA